MSYRVIRDRLASIPDKRFSRGVYWDGNTQCACVIGALLPSTRKVRDNEFREVPSITQAAELFPAVRNEIEDLDVTIFELQHLQNVNDVTRGASDQRYVDVMSWLETKVAEQEKA